MKLMSPEFKQFKCDMSDKTTDQKIEYVSSLSPAEICDMHDAYTEWTWFPYMYKRNTSFTNDKENFDILTKFINDWEL